jgi:glycosyltransferase involved in cell wall biosynthesis
MTAVGAGRDLLFYGGFPLGYHNPVGERKALAFQTAGYRVHYTQGVGIRDPQFSRLTKVVAFARARAGRSRAPMSAYGGAGLMLRPLLVLPPRRVRVVRRFNDAWLERQMRRFLPDPAATVVWVRFPSPEFVDLLPRLNARIVVYECADAMHLTPGTEQGPWKAIFDRAERDLVARADAVVVHTPTLAERFEGWGASVRLVPHGVDLFPMSERPRRRGAGPVVAGFVGTLDRRVDSEIIRAIAKAEPTWRIRLIGPVGVGFDRVSLRDLQNVSIEPAVPYQQLGEVLASFDLGLMPYFDHPMYRGMSPVKNLELLAAGVPAVARPTPALEPYRDVVRMATSPDEFVAQLREALANDSPVQAQRRRARAEGWTWDKVHAALIALLQELEDRAASTGASTAAPG